MVETKEGLELSRISLLKFIDDNIGNTYEIIYDSYVKPTNKILDYKTQYSGINENTIKRFKSLNCELNELVAVIGPCIKKENYEVGNEFYDRFIKKNKKQT